MADYFAVDPSVVRLIFLGAGLINPSGALLAYLVMVMVIPESPLFETAEE
jgi:phage shock protein PspC (stress-responsive transcriptional regulator)